MKKLHFDDMKKISDLTDADQIVVFAFNDKIVDVSSWGRTQHQYDQARQWSDKRFNEFVAGLLRPPSEERVRRRCKLTKEMFP